MNINGNNISFLRLKTLPKGIDISEQGKKITELLLYYCKMIMIRNQMSYLKIWILIYMIK